MSLSEFQIIQSLNKLGIHYDGNFNHSGWLPILCPFHSDKNIGNAFINRSSVIKCFSCGAKSNLYRAVKIIKPNLSPKEIFEFLGEEQTSKLDRLLEERLERRRQEQTIEKAKRIFKVNYDLLDKVEVDLNCYYSKTREFTKEWVDYFNVVQIKTGFYQDSYCIPITFKGQTITYEFRKAYEYEKLKERYPRSRGKLEDLRKKFINEAVKDEYLSKPKTLYPLGNTEHKKILFNYDRLNLNEDVYISEGIAGTAEIFKKVSKNVTSTFGVMFSPSQVDLLRTIKGRKVIIPDGDEASDTYIWNLSNLIEGVYVYPQMIPGAEYLLKKSGLMEFQIK